VEATITVFSFVRLFRDRVKEVIIGNTYQLKQIGLARNNTDKIDADKLCRALKAQVLSGVQQVIPVTLPPPEIQDLRNLFSTYRLYGEQNTRLKNRIHSPLKERIPLHAEPFMKQIGLLTSMKGISVFIAIAVITDVISVSRFKGSKHFTSYPRSVPRVANSNTTVRNRGTNKMGRKLSATLLTQSLNHALSASLKLRDWYNRLCEYKKAGLVRTGLRRRVFAEIYQMLKKGEYHYGREAKKHEAKMARYKCFLEKHKSQALLKKSA
jgi:transposase